MEREDSVTESDLYKRLIESFLSPCDANAQYEFIKQLGQGTFGCVSKAKHRETGDIAAIKTIILGHHGKDCKNVVREISAIIKLQPNENIVRLLDIFKGKENKLHFVMELCDEDLAKFMANDANHSDRLLFDIAQQIAKGISTLHTNKPAIIHRDIKPENILLVIGERPTDIVVKIADFGISSIDIVDVDSTGTSFIPIMHTDRPQGTYPYMPPECYAAMDGHGVVDGKFVFDASVDIFSLGLVYVYIFCYQSNRYG